MTSTTRAKIVMPAWMKRMQRRRSPEEHVMVRFESRLASNGFVVHFGSSRRVEAKAQIGDKLCILQETGPFEMLK